MKSLALATAVCVVCSVACNAIIAAVSFAVFVVTASVFAWRQSKIENNNK